MNDIINKYLLAGDKFMSEFALVDYLPKTKKETKNLKKLVIQDVFTQVN